MHFKTKLIPGKLIRRYKRFLADVELENVEVVSAHCTNSGSMISCIEEGAAVYLSPATDPKRKTRFTWEMILINNKWVGINTNIPNILVYEAVRDRAIPALDQYTNVRREVKFEDSRFDVYAENETEKCFIEVKNVSMKVGDAALFPDAVTSRGRKHLETLIRVKQQGMRAIMVYVVQRMDVKSFGPARHIDPDYADSLQKAIRTGVEVIALQAEVSPTEITITGELPLIGMEK